jgi:hypothetical protein
MSTYSDEPVLVKPDAKSTRKLWLLVSVALAAAGLIVYIPIDKARMEERAHHAERGPRQGTLIRLEIEGRPHTLELTWFQNRFAPVLDPAPAEGVTLSLRSRKGSETLAWNAELACFGPVAFEVDPYAHHKLSLRLEKAGATLWQNTAWAYGIHDTHGHSH